MQWLGEFLSKLSKEHARVIRVTIVAKCGVSERTLACGELPAGMPRPQVREMANVGRCDHSWASFFHAEYRSLASRIICLKDSYLLHNQLPRVPVRSLVEGSHEGFACAYRMVNHPSAKSWRPTLCTKKLAFDWSLAGYSKTHDQSAGRRASRASKNGQNRTGGFAATRQPYRAWARGLIPMRSTSEPRHVAVQASARSLWPLCLGGGFATTREAVQHVPRQRWQAIAQTMGRADNVEESHYMERTWAAMLSPPQMWRSSGGPSIFCLGGNS
jgi:hypothetical protein